MLRRTPAVSVRASASGDVKSLKLAFLPGTGRMGGALAKLHAKHGFKNITIASRDPARAKEAAGVMQGQLPAGAPVIHHAGLHQAVEGADVVFWIAGPTGSACKSPDDLKPRFETLKTLKSVLKGKMIVDCTNIMYAYPDEWWGKTSSLLQSMETVPDARWTCAWKSVFFKRVLSDPAPDPSNPMSVLVCGDDAEAKRTTITLVDQLPGFKGLDAGSANHSRILELLGPKWLQELEAWNFQDKYVAGWRYGP